MRPKILIGYDGSPEGEDALGLGRQLSETLDARPLVATVITHPRKGTEPGEFNAAVTSYCEPLFARAKQRLKGLEVKAEPILNDSPAAGIYELTDWQRPTAIVIGSTRHGTTGRVQVGTVGGSLLSGVHSTVAVAPRGYADHGASGLTRIGVAVDGSSESWRALAAAARLAQRAGSPLCILSVMGAPHYILGGLLSPLGPEEYRQFKEKEWGRVYESAAGRVPDLPTEPLLLHGDPAEALSEAAADLDLLVLGSRGYGPVKGTVLGSVSGRVMAAAASPVMVVPRGAGSAPLGA